MKVMDALRHQIRSYAIATSGGETKDAKDKIEILIQKLLAMVDKVKEEHDMGERVLMMPPATYEFQMYKYIRYFEAFGYHYLAQLYSGDLSEDGTKIQIHYYSGARAIYDAFGYEAQSKFMTENIRRIRAESGGDKKHSLKFYKKLYLHELKGAGKNSEHTILPGIEYAMRLLQANQWIEAERLLTKLAAISQQVYGEDHSCTVKTALLLKNCKRRLVLLDFHSGDKYQALRYETDGEICILTGPIVDEYDEGQTFRIESALMYPRAGCPVVCYGLINAPHLNGKLGEVRSIVEDSSGGVRFGVHFEEKGLMPAAVKSENLRIAFELPMRDIDETSTSSG
jgi:hypothetical protein